MLIATILTDNREATIERAVSSALTVVDKVAVIDTGATDRTVERAKAAGGGSVVVHRWAWVGSFACARNEALRVAAMLGAHWSLMVDSDERVICDDREGVRNRLRRAHESALMCQDESRTHYRERLIRADAGCQWIGRTHEALVSPGPVGRCEGLRLEGAAKSPEQMRAKLERDRDALRLDTRENPDDPRWWYYLGDTLAGLGDNAAAIEAFSRCVDLRGWDEQRAWACYRVAVLRGNAAQWELAIQWCLDGIGYHAGMAELFWFAGFCSYQLGEIDQAARFAALASRLGIGTGAHSDRIGFCHLPALYEGPADVLHWCALKRGNPVAAEHWANVRDRLAELRTV